MRHNKNFNHLGRQAGHRKAMLSNMASSLILHKRIETTVAKAKAVKQFVEPLVTKSKEDTTHSRRIVFSYLKQKEAVTELFRTIAPKIADRPGGYTRILKTGFRLGDAADMCIIEFVDFNEAYTLGILPTAAEAKPKTRRSRGKKAADAAAEAATATEGGEEKKAAKPAAKKAVAAKPAASRLRPVRRKPLLRRLPRRPTWARRCNSEYGWKKKDGVSTSSFFCGAVGLEFIFPDRSENPRRHRSLCRPVPV